MRRGMRRMLLPSLAGGRPLWASRGRALWQGQTARCLSSYAEEMHRAWQRDPESVDASWAAYFASGDATAPSESSGGERRGHGHERHVARDGLPDARA